MKWTSFLTGYVEISLRGKNPERVLNMAFSRGLPIGDIRLKDEEHYQLRVGLSQYKAFRLLARRAACRVKIKRKKGLPFFLLRAKKRKVLVGGALFFCLILYVFSSFVWFIDVQGNVDVATKRILTKAAEHGLERGVPKASIQNNILAQKLLLELSELSWVGIHVHGVRIVIEVVEKTLPPEKEEGRDTDLIARIGGKIEELLVLKGTPLVEEGDTVKKGQTLISGLVYPEIIISETGEISPAGEAQIVKARGLVRALVQRSYRGQCPFREKIVWDTGVEKRTIFLRLGEKEIYLKGTKENPYPQYRLVRRVKPLFVLQGKRLSGPLEIVSIIYKEQVCQTKEWGIEGAFQEAARRAQDLVWGEVPGQHKIVSQKFEPLFEPEKETLSVRYVLETIEEIGTYGF